MTAFAPIKPKHKAILLYYEALQGFAAHNVTHELAVRSAFQTLLADTAKSHGWLLVPEQGQKKPGKGRVIPDATIYDQFKLIRGYWEAKDTNDDLDTEISKKTAKGYPLTNTIFEDTRHGVLFQGKQEVLRADLTQPQALADLLNLFFGYVQPEYQSFEEAVAEFKDRVPDLAGGLAEKIKTAHRDDPKFQAAFDAFFAVCQQTLNPNIAQAAVDEMLVQHLLTERLIRKIFDNPDFSRHNVIAAEVEKVIDALVSHSFNRDDFQKSLDRFYIAIENAARTLPEFRDKQHFLNTVYERFFQGYSVKLADTHGIVYTPQAIVDFMCASVAEVLEKEFGLSLGAPGVNILDPCTGTGNFIVNLLHRIPKKDLPRMYREQLFANEVMLLPYYIAALNIEHAYYELTGKYEPFEGLCFVDTLDMAEHKDTFNFMTEDNTKRVERQKKAPITVIIGNPPYNVGQINENDNNKNRKYPAIEKRIKQTYAKDSTATLKTQLYDPYVKFFRWATDRIGQGPGVVCLVTNNGFLEGRSFDGFRKHLSQDFDLIYHLNLKGDAHTTAERRRQEGGNIFNDQIRVGIGITILAKTGKRSTPALKYFRVSDYWRSEQKAEFLVSNMRHSVIPWTPLIADERNSWLVPANANEFASFMPIGSKAGKASKQSEVLFKQYCGGVKSNRDAVVYDFAERALSTRMKSFLEAYNAEVDRFRRAGSPVDIDAFVRTDQIKWDGTLKEHLKDYINGQFSPTSIRLALYRPFARQHLYFDRLCLNSVYLQHYFFPRPATQEENWSIWLKIGSNWSMFSLMTNCIVDLLPQGGSQCFPFYVYDEDGSNRRENITDWALKQFQDHYGKLPLGDEPLADARGSAGRALSEPRTSASDVRDTTLPDGRGSESTSGVRDTTLPDGRGSESASGASPAPHSDALAYFITFHTYGSWLHGRAEGSVDPQHNIPGTPTLSPDEEREQAEYRRLKAPPVSLAAKARSVVERTVGEVCSHRGWTMHAINVRTNSTVRLIPKCL